MTVNSPRKPRVVAADDPSVDMLSDDEFEYRPDYEPDATAAAQPAASGKLQPRLRRGIKWGTVFIAAMLGLAGLAASLSFAAFITAVVSRDDWIGWFGYGLLGVAGLAFIVLAAREFAGLVRVSRLTRLRKDIDGALRGRDLAKERATVKRLQALYAPRDDLKWHLARLKEHQGDVRDPGELLRLADRDLVAPLDRQARSVILASAKRVTVATAISPMVWIAMLFVVAENIRLIRRLATLYGARPGGVGALKLARMVLTHILATGGLAMTDDLLGQFLGQDLVRRLSRRLGEGVFNGALTARIGTAAVAVTRPLPFLDSPPLRLRDVMRELVRTTTAAKPKAA